MKLRQILFFLAFFLLWSESNCQTLTMLTYNIRFDNPADGPNAWPLRKVWMCEQIRAINPDVFGIQEGLDRQVRYIDSSFADYKHIGVGRDDGKSKGEFSAVWYNTRSIELLKKGTFWLSPTPEKVSVGWDAALPRICTYGFFKDISSGKKFWVFNTHFDHIGVEARKNSAKLIIQKIKKLNKTGLPVILMGDFNSTPDSDPITIISKEFQDSKSADKSMTMGPDGTFNGFDQSKPSVERIDFIFAGNGAKAESYQVIRETKDGKFASDHYPVISRIVLH